MLTINSLSVTFNDVLLLKNISLTIAPGTTHALMGPNGSGKSTLALTLLGADQYKVESGSIMYDKQDLLALPTEKRARAGIFLSLQQPPALGVEVLTFLKEAHRMLTGNTLPIAEFKELVVKAFDAVQLDHSFMYRSVHEGFSGGEKKRFEIAQLLLFKPRLALLDEIDSGLDSDALKHIAMLLKQEQAATGMTLFIITHYPRLLSYVQPDRIHVLYKGQIVVSSDMSIAHAIEERGYDGLFL